MTEAEFQRALDLHEHGRLAEAESLFRAILARDPKHARAHHLLGIIALQRGQYRDAVGLIDAALALQPDYADACADRGAALFALRRLDEALESYDRALALKGDAAPAELLSNRGGALLELGRPAEALAAFERALTLKPATPEILYNSGNALARLSRYAEALARFDQALAIRPTYIQALANRGNMLLRLQRPLEALASYDRTLGLKPDYAEGYFNRGAALYFLKRLDEALAQYDRGLTYQPRSADAHYNRGNVLRELQRLDEALASYGRALAIDPAHADAHWNEANCRLLAGDFERGWQKFEWRWRIKPQSDWARAWPGRLWLGEEDIAGKTLLLIAEQGFGDALQMCRYARLAAGRGARVVLEAPPALTRLLASLDGASRIVVKGDALPPIDLHCPMMSLPLAFRTTLSRVPADVPYLQAPPEVVARWQAILGPKTGLRVGLAWSGSPTHNNDAHRSMAPRLLAPLLECNASFFSLQKEYRAEDRAWLAAHPEIRDTSESLRDFTDTAALASLMDVVISVDTSVAHLTGALGQRVWIMLSYLGLDRRWMLARDDSPWYPTARLYRQPAIDAWEDVMARITRDLSALKAD